MEELMQIPMAESIKSSSAASTATNVTVRNNITKDETIIKPAAVKIIHETEKSSSSRPKPFMLNSSSKGTTKITRVILDEIPKYKVKSPPKLRVIKSPISEKVAAPSFSKTILSDIRVSRGDPFQLEDKVKITENIAPAKSPPIENQELPPSAVSNKSESDQQIEETEKSIRQTVIAIVPEMDNTPIPVADKMPIDDIETEKTDNEGHDNELNLTLNPVDYVLKSNTLNIKQNNASTNNAKSPVLETTSAIKKEKSYNQDRAREYIKLQKQKRRLEYQTTKMKTVENEKDLIKKRLDELKKNSLKIVDKNVKKARKNSIRKFGSKPKIDSSRTVAGENGVSSGQSNKTVSSPGIAYKLKLKPPAQLNSGSNATGSVKKTINNDVIKKPSIPSERMATLNKRILHLSPEANHNIGLLRKANVSLNASNTSVILSSSFKKMNEPDVSIKNHQSETKDDDKLEVETTKNSSLGLGLVDTVEDEIKLSVPEITLQSSTLHQTTTAHDARETKSNVPYWLKQTYVQPHPYNFIMAVRKKLEAVTDVHPKTSHSESKSSFNRTDDAHSRISFNNKTNVKEPAKLEKEIALKPKETPQQPHMSPVSVHNSEPNTISEISSIKSETFIPVDSPNRTGNDFELDTSNTSTQTTPPANPKITEARLSPLSKDAVTHLKINPKTDLSNVNVHRGNIMPDSDKLGDRISFINKNVNNELREHSRLTMNNTEMYNNFIRRNRADAGPQQQHSHTEQSAIEKTTYRDDDYKKMLEAFNKSLSQVIEVNKKLYSALVSQDKRQEEEEAKQRENTLMEEQSQIIVSIDMNNSNNSNYSDDFEKHTDTSINTEENMSQAEGENDNTAPADGERKAKGERPTNRMVNKKANYFQPIYDNQEEYRKITDDDLINDKENQKNREAVQSKLNNKSKVNKKNDDIGETIKSMKIVNLWNEGEFGNDIYSSTFNQSDLEVSYKSNGNLSETNISYSSFGVVEQSIKTENFKSKHLVDLIKIREKSLIDRTKAQIALLQVQKQKFREQGMILQIPPIKKKQRAILVKLEKDLAEIKKMTKAPTFAVQTRTGHKFEKMNLKLIGIRNSKTPHKREPQRQTAIKAIEIEPGKDLEKILMKRETELRRRRENVEHLLKWHQKLNEEEENVAELEQQIFNYNFARINNNTASKGDRTTHNCKKIRQIERSIRILQNISLASGDNSSTIEESVEISGSQMNKLWKRLTGHRELKFDAMQNYKMSKTDLERIYEEAKTTVLREFEDNNKIGRLMDDSFMRPSSGPVYEEPAKDISVESLIKSIEKVEIIDKEDEKSDATPEEKTDKSYQTEEKSDETLKEKSIISIEFVEKNADMLEEHVIKSYQTLSIPNSIDSSTLKSNITLNVVVEEPVDSAPLDIQDKDNKLSETSISDDFSEDLKEGNDGTLTNDKDKSDKITDDSIAEILESVDTASISASSNENERTYEIIREINNDSEDDVEELVPDASEPEPEYNDHIKFSLNESSTQKSPLNESVECEELIEDMSFPNYDPTINETNFINSLQKSTADSDNVMFDDNYDIVTTDIDNSLSHDNNINNSGEYKTDKSTAETSSTTSTTGDLKNRLITLNNSLEELSGAFQRAPIMDVDYNKKPGSISTDITPSSSMSTTQDDYSTDKDFDLDIDIDDISDDKYSGSIVKNLEEELKEQFIMEVKIRNKNAEAPIDTANNMSSGSSSSSSTVKEEISEEKDGKSASSVVVSNFVSVIHDFMPIDFNAKILGMTSTTTTATNRIMPDIINEAEVLRRQQLQIEQEIKQLEQQVPYALLREIPNKPPPPYIPPAQGNRLPLIFPDEQRFNELITNRIDQLYNNLYTDIKELNEEDPEIISPNDKSQCGNIYETIILDLCNELYREFRDPSHSVQVTFKTPKNYKKPLAFYNPPDDLKCLQKYIIEKIKKILVPSDNHLNASSSLMESCRPIQTGVFCFTKRKRDHVDEILVREMLEEEEKWTNFDEEEIQVKNEVTNDIINRFITEALSDIEKAFNNKRKKCT